VYEVVEDGDAALALAGYLDLMLLARLPKKPLPVLNSDWALD
jgi:hypothetical protein